MNLSLIKHAVQHQQVLTSKLFGWSRTSRNNPLGSAQQSCNAFRKFYQPIRPFSLDIRKGQNHDRTGSGSSRDADPSLQWLRSGQNYMDGPDQFIPSKAPYTWHIDGAVSFNPLAQEPGKSRPPESIPGLLKKSAETYTGKPALAVKREGKWINWTYDEYYEDSRTVAKAFIALGLERFHGVCILGFNSPEWFIANIGATMAGGIPAGIYTTNRASSCAYIAEDSRANIIVLEDDEQLTKVLQHREYLPHLKAIVQYRGKPAAEGVLSWNELMKLGKESSEQDLNQRLKQIGVNQCATLIYTSGTTGNPKGVMLSHDNLTWPALEFTNTAKFPDPPLSTISFLPLSHVAAQHTDIYMPMVGGGKVCFAEPDALRGSLVNTMREVQPNIFLAVPRVWEKFYEKLREVAAQNKGLKLKIATWAKAQAAECNTKRMAGETNSDTTQYKIAKKLIFSKLHQALGLSKAEMCITAAAPISMELLEYFRSLDIIVAEAYGLSECSGPHTCNLPLENKVRFGSIGPTIGGMVSRLDKPSETGEGELCLGGRHVFMGYLNQEGKTKAAIDKDGWFHTEDLARIDSDGFIYITGRMKELIITAGGENVAPVPIEDNIKTCLPIISNAILVGDKLKYVSVLLTLKSEIDPDTNAPLDALTEATRDWVNKHGYCSAKTVTDVRDELYKKKNSKLFNAINTGVMLANAKCTSRASKVKKWVILPKDFSIPGGELGPTLKLKRSVVVKQYQHVIDKLYKGTDDPNKSHALGG